MQTVKRYSILLILTLALQGLVACGGGGETRSTSPTAPPTPPTVPPTSDPKLPIEGFVPLSKTQWDNLAVRKVLHTFAFGGHASDQQIQSWADMDPVSAITQMLTFDEHNLLLSPPAPGDSDNLSNRSGNLRDLALFWASDDPNNVVPNDRRPLFDYSASGDGWVEHLWPTAAAVRGLNPFRQKIVYWEVNQHMAVNLNTDLSVEALLQYYDDIAEALESGTPYSQVMAIAARSAAVAIQYGHRKNRFVDNTCFCNEDFAREFYQLFFGILGEDDPLYHESVTIKNTAKALTGLTVGFDPVGEYLPTAEYGTELHFPGALEILGQSIGGTQAKERLELAADVAINHPESLANLPLMIVTGLADTNLDDNDVATLQRAWASMPSKDLLLFLRGYATSTMFHDSSRLIYMSSIARRLLIDNKITSSNEEIYQRVYSVVGHVAEGVETFRPINNVFGGQTGELASNSANVFRSRFNQATDSSWQYRLFDFEQGDYVWQKNWLSVIEDANDPGYTVAEAADWLWNHFIGDGLKNFGALERAHLYALLATGRDLALHLNPDNVDVIYTEADVTSNSTYADAISTLGAQPLSLATTDPDERRRVSFRIGQSVSFIASTPYSFYQEGR